MKYDLDQVGPRTEVTDVYPELLEIGSWKYFIEHVRNTSTDAGFRPTKFLRFILLFYSKESKLNTSKERLPFDKRVMQALEIIGYPKGTDNSPGWNGYTMRTYNRLILLEDDLIYDMVMDFLVFQGDRLWAKIVSVEAMIWDSLRRIGKPITGLDDKKAIDANVNQNKLIQQMDYNEQLLDKYLSEFFISDEELKDKVYQKEKLSNKAMKSRIEGYAREPGYKL